LMVCLDLIIDPVTLLGDRWFLGKIYYYPSPGPYFGVTLENFAGWFVVCVAILRLYFGLESRLLGKVARAERAASLLPLRVEALAPVAAYFGVMVFNLAVTFWIGEPLLGGVSCLVAGSVLLCVTLAFRSMEAGVRERRPAWTERPALSPLAGAPGEGRRQRAPEM